MQPDERFNTPEEYDRVMGVIRGLVPCFTREYLTAYLSRFVVHKDGMMLDVCGVKSSTSIFVSGLRPSPDRYGGHDDEKKYELIEYRAPGSQRSRGTDIRLQDHDGEDYILPGRPALSSNTVGIMRPQMDYSLRECGKLVSFGCAFAVGVFETWRVGVPCRPGLFHVGP